VTEPPLPPRPDAPKATPTGDNVRFGLGLGVTIAWLWLLVYVYIRGWSVISDAGEPPGTLFIGFFWTVAHFFGGAILSLIVLATWQWLWRTGDFSPEAKEQRRQFDRAMAPVWAEERRLEAQGRSRLMTAGWDGESPEPPPEPADSARLAVPSRRLVRKKKSVNSAYRPRKGEWATCDSICNDQTIHGTEIYWWEWE
jgi:hypothetical protein